MSFKQQIDESNAEPTCYDPGTQEERLQYLVSKMASVSKTISKISRWGLDSVEPRFGHASYGKSNAVILAEQLDAVEKAIGAVEADLAGVVSAVSSSASEAFYTVGVVLEDFRREFGLAEVTSLIRGVAAVDRLDDVPPRYWPLLVKAAKDRLELKPEPQKTVESCGPKSKKAPLLFEDIPNAPWTEEKILALARLHRKQFGTDPTIALLRDHGFSAILGVVRAMKGRINPKERGDARALLLKMQHNLTGICDDEDDFA